MAPPCARHRTYDPDHMSAAGTVTLSTLQMRPPRYGNEKALSQFNQLQTRAVNGRSLRALAPAPPGDTAPTRKRGTAEPLGLLPPPASVLPEALMASPCYLPSPPGPHRSPPCPRWASTDGRPRFGPRGNPQPRPAGSSPATTLCLGQLGPWEHGTRTRHSLGSLRKHAWVGEQVEGRGEWCQGWGRGQGSSRPSPGASPCTSLHLAVHSSHLSRPLITRKR